MVPIGWDHAPTVNGLTETLVLACVGKAIVSVQNPLRLDRFVDLQQRILEVHRKPAGDGYAEISTHRRDGRIVREAAPEIAVALERVFDYWG